jgi:hypothetical protein
VVGLGDLSPIHFDRSEKCRRWQLRTLPSLIVIALLAEYAV